MSAHHDHGDHQAHGAGSRRRLTVALCLAAVYMVAEVVGGLWTGSLALLADAGHMLSDVGALALSLFAIRMAGRPVTAERTYGFYRTEILAALVHGATLVAISGFILVEAVERFREPREIAAPAMMAVAAGGLVVNLAALGILHGGRSASLNVRGAWLHVLTDALGSVQALGAGALIWAFAWSWVDPLASVAIALLVVYSAWHLLREAVAVLMEGTPGHIDVDEVRSSLLDVRGTAGVHDLHVWTITSGFVALSAHVESAPGEPHGELLRRLQQRLEERFGIRHATLQIEPEGYERCAVPGCG